jgi:hypothetical protein
LCADDVGRHEVGCELDPGELDVDRVGQGLEQLCLAEARHAFEQRMALAQQARQHPADETGLADDDLADLGLDGGCGGGVFLGRDRHRCSCCCCQSPSLAMVGQWSSSAVVVGQSP